MWLWTHKHKSEWGSGYLAVYLVSESLQKPQWAGSEYRVADYQHVSYVCEQALAPLICLSSYCKHCNWISDQWFKKII